jgi:hypothetical protein
VVPNHWSKQRVYYKFAAHALCGAGWQTCLFCGAANPGCSRLFSRLSSPAHPPVSAARDAPEVAAPAHVNAPRSRPGRLFKKTRFHSATRHPAKARVNNLQGNPFCKMFVALKKQEVIRRRMEPSMSLTLHRTGSCARVCRADPLVRAGPPGPALRPAKQPMRSPRGRMGRPPAKAEWGARPVPEPVPGGAAHHDRRTSDCA